MCRHSYRPSLSHEKSDCYPFYVSACVLLKREDVVTVASHVCIKYFGPRAPSKPALLVLVGLVLVCPVLVNITAASNSATSLASADRGICALINAILVNNDEHLAALESGF